MTRLLRPFLPDGIQSVRHLHNKVQYCKGTLKDTVKCAVKVLQNILPKRCCKGTVNIL